MAYTDPQQELFVAIKGELEALGYAVYDGFLPPEGTAYPFIYMGDFRQIDRADKTKVSGTVYPTIHVWMDSPKKRGTLSNILLDVKRVCRKIERTANFVWLVLNLNQHILPDNTTKTPLLHGVIEAEIKFS